MGLDSVELIMEIEDEFQVSIPDAEAENLAVLGDLREHIVRALRDRDPPVTEAEVWQRLHSLLVESFGVNPTKIVPTAHIVADLGIN